VAGGAALGLVAQIVLPYPRPPAFLVALGLYFGGVQGYVGWALFTEAQRRAGITRLRLWLAGAGTALATLIVLAEGMGWSFGARLLPVFSLPLVLGTAAGYYLGLAPPRRLVRAWQEREFTRLLRRTAERAPDAREDAIADDLNLAATRAVTAAATLVLLGRSELTIYATTEPAWEGLRVTPQVGLVGVAQNGTSPVVGAPDECERPLDQCLAGEVVAAIPIAQSAPGWGVLLLVQRRASIYADVDLSLLGTLCRHAADVLDHARLMHDERRPSERPAVVQELVGL
ncbi:MAG TPA: hypothetical protein VMM93_12445, partial [Vicinamibacterales bacterium]|nr:hypothetical protein [Vicinamibacterales bacterium]